MRCLACEGDARAGQVSARHKRRAAVDEQDRAPVLAEEAHPGHDRVHGGDRAVDREFDRTHEIRGRRLHDRAHEVLLRQRAVLEDLDRTESLGHRLQRAGQPAGLRTSAAKPAADLRRPW